MSQPSQSLTELQDLLEHLLQNLVDNPEEVSVEGVESSQWFMFDVKVAPNDFGKVIGKRGRNADALRTLMSSVSTRMGKKCKVEILDPKNHYSK